MARVEAAPVRTDERTMAVPRKTRVIVKHVGPWSVFRFALLFYFCVMLVVLFGMALLYQVLGALGVLDSTARSLSGLGFAKDFTFHGWWLFTRAFAIGVVVVIFGAVVKVLVTVLRNLISEVVGGIEMTFTERR